MEKQDRPGLGRWDGIPGIPHSVPLQMPDAKDDRKTLLYGPHGQAILIQQPRTLGFKPPR